MRCPTKQQPQPGPGPPANHHSYCLEITGSVFCRQTAHLRKKKQGAMRKREMYFWMMRPFYSREGET